MRRLAGAVCVVAMVLSVAGCGSSKGLHTKLYRIPSPAMEPTYKIGDHVVANLDAYKSATPKVGDVLIFHPPMGASQQHCGVPSSPADGHPCAKPAGGPDENVQFIKRVVAVPGDQVSIRGNRTFLNGRRQDEAFIKASPCDILCNLPKTITIPPGHYFMLGDNRGESADSRVWGPVAADDLIGRKLFGY
jgi:signal peptidase I